MVSKQASIGGRIVYSDLSGDIFELQRGLKLDGTDREKFVTGGAKEREAFFFTYNIVF